MNAPRPSQRVLHLCFVCSGNICRSPMAAVVLRRRLDEAGLAASATVTSAGIGSWHAGEPIDQRAGETLAAHGLAAGHTAAQVGPEHLAADLLVAMDSGHYRELVRRVENDGGDAAKVRMFRSFDPEAAGRPAADLDVPDPYYSGRNGFAALFTTIERAMPGLAEWVREHS